MKCPFTKIKHKSISTVTLPYLNKKDEEFHLDESHAYYYQVQGQLLCSGRSVCYSCVYTTKDMQVIEIPRNDQFIVGMVPKLKQFLMNIFLPSVLQTYVYQFYDRYSWDGVPS